MKRAFVVLTIDGADHDHPLFNNKDGSVKEFVNEMEIILTVNDHNRDVKNRIKDGETFTGSIIVAQILTF